MKKYNITTTFSHYGTKAEARAIYGPTTEIVTSEFEGTDHEHHSGVFCAILQVNDNEVLSERVEEFLRDNDLRDECFTVRDTTGAEVMTEVDLNLN